MHPLLLPLVLLGQASITVAELESPNWAKMAVDTNHPASFRLAVSRWPDSGDLELPKSIPQVVSGEWRGSGTVEPVRFEFNADATKRTILPPANKPAEGATLLLQTAEKSGQFTDGRIVFHAADATIAGQTAKLERHPGNDRIGFWTDIQDHVTWNYDATRWGRYQVLLTYSTASPDGAEIELEFGGEKLRGVLPSTESWYRYTTLDLGSLYLAKAGKTALTVRCTKLTGPAAMNLKAVTLLPACEGKPPIQADDGVITLNSRDSIVEGTVLRYEPAPNKLTLGYWVKPTDTAVWRFTAKSGGEFDVEILQGCGTGQGGSDAKVAVAGQTHPFVVEETGHFQNFKPRVVGRIKLDAPGEYELRVGPTKIAKSAAMDIREVRLKPIAK